MRWPAPLDKRETLLICLSITVYFLAYNIDTSMRILGIDPATTHGALNRLGWVGTKEIGRDGRKPEGWRDALENNIYGDWTWSRGHIAGDGAERSQPVGTGRHGATWTAREPELINAATSYSDASVNDALTKWGINLPQTRVIKHTAGYTILENAYVFDGTVYLITDNPGSLPPISDIVESVGNGFGRWKTLTSEQAQTVMGTYGSFSLDESIDERGNTLLPPPRRLMFPHNRFFTDANPDFSQHWLRRVRADTGFHPYLAKVALPQLTVEYYEDWEDYQKIGIPFVYERLVVADRRAAEENVEEGWPAYASAFDLDASEYWWEPVRKNVAQFLGEYDVKPGAKKVITYLHTQSDSGAKLSRANHDALIKALQSMSDRQGYELSVVSTLTSDTDWADRMRAIVKSSIIISVHGEHLMDSVFMRPTPPSTLFELFPPNKFERDREYAIQALNLRYIAWQGSKSFEGEDLPAYSPPSDEEVPVDVTSLVLAVQKALS
ncbi:hypothetical protein JR316_0008908 [Psilocybe cubensis]|uniref:Uncharacterized protein n=1 Tax=Psilocybe cubensis TaxID=181762 RepID=A0ACB8GSE6_PSICU|nr:hypothetical protein JR316_0008908 [Psilocybe cubensis]KAH9478453.1 hypothetical protein JR316_0008908 [Psilocybe cubensis]